jgi:hypothetical protein
MVEMERLTMEFSTVSRASYSTSRIMDWPVWEGGPLLALLVEEADGPDVDHARVHGAPENPDLSPMRGAAPRSWCWWTHSNGTGHRSASNASWRPLSRRRVLLHSLSTCLREWETNRIVLRSPACAPCCPGTCAGRRGLATPAPRPPAGCPRPRSWQRRTQGGRACRSNMCAQACRTSRPVRRTPL